MKRSLLAGLGAVAFTATLGLAQTAPAEARSTGVSADAIASTAPAAYTRYRGYRRHAVYGRRGHPYRYGYYRRNRAGAAVAGAALGLIGGIASAAAASSYYDGYYPADTATGMATRPMAMPIRPTATAMATPTAATEAPIGAAATGPMAASGTAAAAGAGSADDEANGYPAAGARGARRSHLPDRSSPVVVAISPAMLMGGRPMKPLRIRKS